MMLAEGTRLGPYRIVTLIGSGGMGEVYRAQDPRLGRDVAIKVLRTRDRVAIERFEREARAVAALVHPNTLAVYDVGEEDGVPYLVSELLVGETLRRRLAKPLCVSDVLSIVRQIADGLIAVHDKRIVHRDLKPENVFVLPDGAVKLLDFGLARMAPATADAATLMATTTGTVIGTMAYMAPERARGLACDGRTDLFALGVMFYEMLAGRRPFEGTSIDVIAAIVSADPKPLPPGVVPDALEAIIRRTLEKEPADRFSSVRDFVFALDMFDKGMQTTHRQTPTAMQPSVAVLPFVDLSPRRDHDYFCDGIAEELLNALARVSGLRVASASRSFQFRGRDVDTRSAAAALDVHTVLEGSIRATDDRLRVSARLVDAAQGHVLWSEQFDRDASDVFAVQDEIARMVVTAVQPRITTVLPSAILRPATTSVSEAYSCYLKGRFHWNKRTERGLTDSIGCFTEARAIDPNFARAAAGLADSYSMLGIHQLRAPDEVMPKSRAAAEAALALDDALPEAHAALAVVRGMYEWERQQAVDEYERMLQLDSQYAAGLQSYAVHGLVPIGRLEDAIDFLRRALAIDPVSLPINGALGFVLTLADRAGEAVDVLRRSLDLEPHGMTHYFLGNALMALGEPARAIEHLQTAVSVSGNRPDMLAALGYGLARSGSPAGAQVVLTQLTELGHRRYVSPVGLARVHAGLGETEAALTELERASEVRAADLSWIHVEPAFRQLAPHPRFKTLLQQLHLVQP